MRYAAPLAALSFILGAIGGLSLAGHPTDAQVPDSPVHPSATVQPLPAASGTPAPSLLPAPTAGRVIQIAEV